MLWSDFAFCIPWYFYRCCVACFRIARLWRCLVHSCSIRCRFVWKSGSLTSYSAASLFDSNRICCVMLPYVITRSCYWPLALAMLLCSRPLALAKLLCLSHQNPRMLTSSCFREVCVACARHHGLCSREVSVAGALALLIAWLAFAIACSVFCSCPLACNFSLDSWLPIISSVVSF